MVNYFLLAPTEAFPKAKLAAGKAIELDESLAEAHTSLAFALHHYDWDWAGAEAEFQRAIALNAGYATAHQWYSEMLVTAGRGAEALAEIQRARELDPLSIVINSNIGRVLFWSKRYDEAIASYRGTLEMDPDHAWTHVHLGMALVEKGDFEEAQRAFQKSRTYFQQGPSSGQAYAYARMGRKAEARRILAEFHRRPALEEANLFFLAGVHAALGDKDAAFAMLERAYQRRSFFLVFLNVHPWLDPLHDDPRFTDLARRINLPDKVSGGRL
jgi:tetratricopeptide (TPR) repeat protein